MSTPHASQRAAEIHHRVDGRQLCILVSGPLDLRCSFRFLAIVSNLNEEVAFCRLDLSRVTQTFSSGLAALILLIRALETKGIDDVAIDACEPAMEAGER
jgi:ABC-type transporter Mla MlaB component